MSELHPNPTVSMDDSDVDDDIYRGEPDPIEPIALDTASIGSSTISSSSSSSLNVGRRLGALANVVEAAISRWARGHSSDSSDASSDSFDTSSASTVSGPRSRRIRRRKSVGSSRVSLQNAKSEQAVIARIRAREGFRTINREFVLLLPVALCPEVTTFNPQPQQRVYRTTSLQVILAQLDVALKKSAKLRKAQVSSPYSGASTLPRGIGRKGKRRVTIDSLPRSIPKSVESSKPQSGWWLDVASPTWNDMRAIGKALHLHPLTLEDILNQEPREKLELFPKLGYYFLVFRALEGERSRERFRRFMVGRYSTGAKMPLGIADEGVIGAANVYMVVFREGIITFHFEDISDHTDRIRSKIMQLEDAFSMTSDWIAHGIIDSIVDTFFPLLKTIERELEELEAYINETPDSRRWTESAKTALETIVVSEDSTQDEKFTSTRDVRFEDTKLEESKSHEKPSLEMLDKLIPSPHRTSCNLKRFYNYMVSLRRRIATAGHETQIVPQSQETLIRMAYTRRIVTFLGRLLASKGEVVTQMQKRLLTMANGSKGLGNGLKDDLEVSYHLSDVQDHIATLQHSLNHYERMLSHSHPAYLLHLRVTLAKARSGNESGFLMLTVISITVVCISVPVGLFSINAHNIPGNNLDTGPFNTFGIIVAAAFLICVTVVLLVKYWQVQARRKYSKKKKV